MSDLLDFGGAGPALHFAHANGYPPAAYTPLLEMLAAHYHVVSQPVRALRPGYQPEQLRGWSQLVDDLQAFLEAGAGQAGAPSWVGVGHSLGGVVTAAVALRQPRLFRALVLIDPVFLPFQLQLAWTVTHALGLGRRVHPLVRAAERRRRIFASADEMFMRYRQAPVFSRIDDRGLRAYVNSAARPLPDGRVELAFTPEWESRIYETGPLNLWPQLKRLRPPVLVIRGAESDTFAATAANALRRRLPRAVVIDVPGAGHLVPLERPAEVGARILEFLQALPPGTA